MSSTANFIVQGVLADGTPILFGAVPSDGTSAPPIHHVSSASQFQAESWDGEHAEHEHHDADEAARRFSIYLEESGVDKQKSVGEGGEGEDDEEEEPIASSAQFERTRSASLAAALLELDPRGVPLVQFFKLATNEPLLEVDEGEDEVEPTGAELVLSQLLFTLRSLKMSGADAKQSEAVQRLRELEEELRAAGAVTPADPAVSEAVARALAVAGAGRDVQIRVNQSKHTTTTKTVYETETPAMAHMDSDQIRKLQQDILADISSAAEHHAGSDAAGTTQKKETAEEGFTNEDGSVVVSKKMTRVVTTTRTTLPGEGEEPSAPESPVESLGSVKDRIARFEQLKDFIPDPSASGAPRSSAQESAEPREESEPSPVPSERSHVVETTTTFTREYYEQEPEEKQEAPVPATREVSSAPVPAVRLLEPEQEHQEHDDHDENLLEPSVGIVITPHTPIPPEHPEDLHESDDDDEPREAPLELSEPEHVAHAELKDTREYSDEELAHELQPSEEHVSTAEIKDIKSYSPTSSEEGKVSPQGVPIAQARHVISPSVASSSTAHDDELAAQFVAESFEKHDEQQVEHMEQQPVYRGHHSPGQTSPIVSEHPIAQEYAESVTSHDEGDNLSLKSGHEPEIAKHSVESVQEEEEEGGLGDYAKKAGMVVGGVIAAPVALAAVGAKAAYDALQRGDKEEEEPEAKEVTTTTIMESPIRHEDIDVPHVEETTVVAPHHHHDDVTETTTTTTVTREYYDESPIPSEAASYSPAPVTETERKEVVSEASPLEEQQQPSEGHHVTETTTTTTVTRQYYDEEPEEPVHSPAPSSHVESEPAISEPHVVETTTTTTVSREYEEEPEEPVHRESPVPSDRSEGRHVTETTTTTTVTREYFDEPEQEPEHKEESFSPAPSSHVESERPLESPAVSEKELPHVVETTTTTTTVTREYEQEPEEAAHSEHHFEATEPVQVHQELQQESPISQRYSETESPIPTEQAPVLHEQRQPESGDESDGEGFGSKALGFAKKAGMVAGAVVAAPVALAAVGAKSAYDALKKDSDEEDVEPEEPKDLSEGQSQIPSEAASSRPEQEHPVEPESPVPSEKEHYPEEPHVVSETTTTTTVTREFYEQEPEEPSYSPAPSSHVESETHELPHAVETTTTTTLHREYEEEPEEPIHHESPVPSERSEGHHVTETTTTTTVTREYFDEPEQEPEHKEESFSPAPPSHVESERPLESPAVSEKELPHVVETTTTTTVTREYEQEPEEPTAGSPSPAPSQEPIVSETTTTTKVTGEYFDEPEHHDELEEPVPSDDQPAFTETTVTREIYEQSEDDQSEPHVIEETTTTTVSRELQEDEHSEGEEDRQEPHVVETTTTTTVTREYENDEPEEPVHREVSPVPSEEKMQLPTYEEPVEKRESPVTHDIPASPTPSEESVHRVVETTTTTTVTRELEHPEESERLSEPYSQPGTPAESEKSIPHAVETTTTTTVTREYYEQEPEEPIHREPSPVLSEPRREYEQQQEAPISPRSSPVPSEKSTQEISQSPAAQYFHEQPEHEHESPIPTEQAPLLHEQRQPESGDESDGEGFGRKVLGFAKKAGMVAGAVVAAPVALAAVGAKSAYDALKKDSDEEDVEPEEQEHLLGESRERRALDSPVDSERDVHQYQQEPIRHESPVASESSSRFEQEDVPESPVPSERSEGHHVTQTTTTTTVTREYFDEPEKEPEHKEESFSPAPSSHVESEHPLAWPAVSEKEFPHVVETTTTTTVTRDYDEEQPEEEDQQSEETTVIREVHEAPEGDEPEHHYIETTTTTVTRETFDEPEEVSEDVQKQESSEIPEPEEPHVVEMTTTTTVTREYDEDRDEGDSSENGSQHVTETTTTTTVTREFYGEEPEELSGAPESPIQSEKESEAQISSPASERSTSVSRETHPEEPHIVETTTTMTVTREYHDEPEEAEELVKEITTTTTVTRELFDEPEVEEPVDEEVGSPVASEKSIPHVIETTITETVTREYQHEEPEEPVHRAVSPVPSEEKVQSPADEVPEIPHVIETRVDSHDAPASPAPSVESVHEHQEPHVVETTTTTTVTREYYDDEEPVKQRESPVTHDIPASPTPSEESVHRVVETTTTTTVTRELEHPEESERLSEPYSQPGTPAESEKSIPHAVETTTTTTVTREYYEQEPEEPFHREASPVHSEPRHEYEQQQEAPNSPRSSPVPSEKSTDEISQPPATQYFHEQPEHEHESPIPTEQAPFLHEQRQPESGDESDGEGFGSKVLGFAKKAGMVAGAVVAAPVALAAVGAKSAYDDLKKDDEEDVEPEEQEHLLGESRERRALDSPVDSEKDVHHYEQEPIRHESPVASESSSRLEQEAIPESPVPSERSEGHHVTQTTTTTTMTREYFDEPEKEPEHKEESFSPAPSSHVESERPLESPAVSEKELPHVVETTTTTTVTREYEQEPEEPTAGSPSPALEQEHVVSETTTTTTVTREYYDEEPEEPIHREVSPVHSDKQDITQFQDEQSPVSSDEKESSPRQVQEESKPEVERQGSYSSGYSPKSPRGSLAESDEESRHVVETTTTTTVIREVHEMPEEQKMAEQEPEARPFESPVPSEGSSRVIETTSTVDTTERFQPEDLESPVKSPYEQPTEYGRVDSHDAPASPAPSVESVHEHQEPHVVETTTTTTVTREYYDDEEPVEQRESPVTHDIPASPTPSEESVHRVVETTTTTTVTREFEHPEESERLSEPSSQPGTPAESEKSIPHAVETTTTTTVTREYYEQEPEEPIHREASPVLSEPRHEYEQPQEAPNSPRPSPVPSEKSTDEISQPPATQYFHEQPEHEHESPIPTEQAPLLHEQRQPESGDESDEEGFERKVLGFAKKAGMVAGAVVAAPVALAAVGAKSAYDALKKDSDEEKEPEEQEHLLGESRERRALDSPVDSEKDVHHYQQEPIRYESPVASESSSRFEHEAVPKSPVASERLEAHHITDTTTHEPIEHPEGGHHFTETTTTTTVTREYFDEPEREPEQKEESFSPAPSSHVESERPLESPAVSEKELPHIVETKTTTTTTVTRDYHDEEPERKEQQPEETSSTITREVYEAPEGDEPDHHYIETTTTSTVTKEVYEPEAPSSATGSEKAYSEQEFPVSEPHIVESSTTTVTREFYEEPEVVRPASGSEADDESHSPPRYLETTTTTTTVTREYEVSEDEEDHPAAREAGSPVPSEESVTRVVERTTTTTVTHEHYEPEAQIEEPHVVESQEYAGSPVPSEEDVHGFVKTTTTTTTVTREHFDSEDEPEEAASTVTSEADVIKSPVTTPGDFDPTQEHIIESREYLGSPDVPGHVIETTTTTTVTREHFEPETEGKDSPTQSEEPIHRTEETTTTTTTTVTREHFDSEDQEPHVVESQQYYSEHAPAEHESPVPTEQAPLLHEQRQPESGDESDGEGFGSKVLGFAKKAGMVAGAVVAAPVALAAVGAKSAYDALKKDSDEEKEPEEQEHLLGESREPEEHRATFYEPAEEDRISREEPKVITPDQSMEEYGAHPEPYVIDSEEYTSAGAQDEPRISSPVHSDSVDSTKEAPAFQDDLEEKEDTPRAGEPTEEPADAPYIIDSEEYEFVSHEEPRISSPVQLDEEEEETPREPEHDEEASIVESEEYIGSSRGSPRPFEDSTTTTVLSVHHEPPAIPEPEVDEEDALEQGRPTLVDSQEVTTVTTVEHVEPEEHTATSPTTVTTVSSEQLEQQEEPHVVESAEYGSFDPERTVEEDEEPQDEAHVVESEQYVGSPVPSEKSVGHVIETTTSTTVTHEHYEPEAQVEEPHVMESQEYAGAPVQSEEDVHGFVKTTTTTTTVTREHFEPEEDVIESEEYTSKSPMAHEHFDPEQEHIIESREYLGSPDVPGHVIETTTTTTVTREYFEPETERKGSPTPSEEPIHRTEETTTTTTTTVTREHFDSEDQEPHVVESQEYHHEEQPEKESPAPTEQAPLLHEQRQPESGDESDEESFGSKALGFAKKAGMVAGAVVAAPVALAAVGAKSAYDALKKDDEEDVEQEEQEHLLGESRERRALDSPVDSEKDVHHYQQEPIGHESPVASEASRTLESPSEEGETHGFIQTTRTTTVTHEHMEPEESSHPAASTVIETQPDSESEGSFVDHGEDIQTSTLPLHSTEAAFKLSTEDVAEQTAEKIVSEVFTPLDRTLIESEQYRASIESLNRPSPVEPKKSVEDDLASEALQNVTKISYGEAEDHKGDGEEEEEDEEWKVYDRHGEVLEEFSTQLTDDVIQEAEGDASTQLMMGQMSQAEYSPRRSKFLKQESCQEISNEPEVDYYSDLQEKLNILAGEKSNLGALPEEEPSSGGASEQLDVIHESDQELSEVEEAAEHTAMELVDQVLEQVVHEISEEEDEDQKTMTSDAYLTATEKDDQDPYDTCVTSQDDTYESAQGWTSQDSEYTTATSQPSSRLSDEDGEHTARDERQETSTPQAMLSPVDSDRHFTVQQDLERDDIPEMPVIIRAFDPDDFMQNTARSTPDVALQVTIEEEDESDDKLPISPSGVLLPPASDPGRPVSPVPPRRGATEQEGGVFVFSRDEDVVAEPTPPPLEYHDERQETDSHHGVAMEASSDAVNSESSRYSRQPSDLSSTAESHAETVIRVSEGRSGGSTDSLEVISVISGGAKEESPEPEDVHAGVVKTTTTIVTKEHIEPEEPEQEGAIKTTTTTTTIEHYQPESGEESDGEGFGSKALGFAKKAGMVAGAVVAAPVALAAVGAKSAYDALKKEGKEEGDSHDFVKTTTTTTTVTREHFEPEEEDVEKKPAEEEEDVHGFVKTTTTTTSVTREHFEPEEEAEKPISHEKDVHEEEDVHGFIKTTSTTTTTTVTREEPEEGVAKSEKPSEQEEDVHGFVKTTNTTTTVTTEHLEPEDTAEQLGFEVYDADTEEQQQTEEQEQQPPQLPLEELETVEEEPEDSDSLNEGGNHSSGHSSVGVPADTLAMIGKYRHQSSDNLSLTSLQEFERLEKEVGARGDGSLTRSEIELLVAGRLNRSGEGSVSSLAEFERLEKEMTENQSPPEDVMMLSDIREESEAEDMSIRDDDEEEALGSDTELKSRPLQEEDLRVITPIAPSPTDSLEHAIDPVQMQYLETSTDSLEPTFQEIEVEQRPDSAEDTSLTEYEMVPRVMEASTTDSLDGTATIEKDSLLEGASQGIESTQSTHGLLSGDTIGTVAEDDDDDKDSLDGEVSSMLQSYPTTLTTFQTTVVAPDGSVQTISRRVETRVTDPLVSHVTFTGTESQERLDQLPDDEQFETVDTEGNVTRTTFRRDQHPHF